MKKTKEEPGAGFATNLQQFGLYYQLNRLTHPQIFFPNSASAIPRLRVSCWCEIKSHAVVFHPSDRQTHTGAAVLYHIDNRFYHGFLLATRFVSSYLHHWHLHHTDGLWEEEGRKAAWIKKRKENGKKRLSSTIERRRKNKNRLMRMEGVETEVEEEEQKGGINRR